MNRPKTKREVKDEVAALKKMKPKIQRRDFFGGDNWRKIDITIRVLENDMDEDEINEAFSGADENSIAFEAMAWRDGEQVDYSPTENWKSLVKE